MKILQLTKKFPYPLKDGEAIAVTNLARALTDLSCELSLLSMNTHKHYCQLDRLPSAMQHYDKVYTVEVDNRIKPWDAAINLLRNRSYHIARFDQHHFRRQLIRLLQQESFDIIQLETLYLAPYIEDIRQHSDAIIALRTHNVEHEIWERLAINAPFGLKKWYLRKLVQQLKSYELQQIHKCDLLVPISERDLAYFRKMGYEGPATVVPIGIDSRQYIPGKVDFSTFPVLGFIGSLDWIPNQEGLDWFLEKVWSKVPNRFPDMQLHIAGRNMPERYTKRDWPNVRVHGEVPNAQDYMNQYAVIVVPLLSGSGMRAKILEAMALGRAVITTSVALEGIEAESGEEVLLADQPETFLNCLRYVYQNPEDLRTIGERARQCVLERYDNRKVAGRLVEVYRSFLVEHPIS